MTTDRTQIEALYRKYFVEIWKVNPFPITLRHDDVVDFVLWLKSNELL